MKSQLERGEEEERDWVHDTTSPEKMARRREGAR